MIAMSENDPSLIWLFIKTTLLTIFFLLIFFFLTIIGVVIFAYHEYNIFLGNAGVTSDQFVQTIKDGWNTPPAQDNDHVNFLILGTDDLANRGDGSSLTDTMLLASLNVKNGSISMYSIPRDIWLPDYKTKINALYQYGKDRYPTEPQRFPREVLENLTGLKIQHTVVINLDTLAGMIDAMGGVDVNIKEGFVDPQFPKPDVDVTKVHDPKLLYETVEFKQGVEHMSGARVLIYVRSRHSASDQGNDLARSQRQQEVIQGIASTFKQKNFYKDIPRLGRLYKFYVDHFGQYLSVSDGIGLVRALIPNRNTITFAKEGPTIFPDDPNGVLVHPAITRLQPQWIYQIRSLDNFKKEVQAKLGY